MQRNCRQCQATFDITPDDLAFYEKVSPVFNGKKEMIPPSTLCPECRGQKRLTFRNERHLYHRPCSFTGKMLISFFAPESLYPVYGADAWWGDGWDELSFGKPFDLHRSFFAQFEELQRQVPRLHLMAVGNENADYVNYTYDSRNSYLIFATRSAENTLHSSTILEIRDSMDLLFCEHCELCYECTDCTRCYHCIGCRDCNGCTDCLFSYDCLGCTSCIGCRGLRNKKYHVRNVAVSKEEYGKELLALRLHTASGYRTSFEDAQAFHGQGIHRALTMKQCEDCTGDRLVESSHCHHCFDGFRVEESRYCSWILRSHACGDAYGVSDAAFLYEAMGCNMQRGACCTSCRYDADLLYCDHCFYTEQCFGCVGLRHKKHCILNKQYTKEEYETLVPKIIEHMRKTGEWGEFFPVELSPFAYNETVAQEYFPLTKEECLKRGWKWRDETDEMPRVSKVFPASQLPDAIEDIPDDILQWAVECDVTKRPFKIVKQELEFYRKMRLPVPRFHPDERHRRRMALRNPRKLWKRPCMKCGKEMETTYSPERPEIVYCETCYLQEVYWAYRE